MRLDDNRGAVILIIVVLISTVAFLMAYSAMMLSLGDLELSFSHQKGEETLSLADSCGEEALYRLRLDNNYNGGVLIKDDGSCIIEVVDPLTAIDREITVIANIDIYHKKIQIDVDLINNGLVVLDWHDLNL